MKQSEQFWETRAKLEEAFTGESRRGLGTAASPALHFENGGNAVEARHAHDLRLERLEPDHVSDATVMLTAIEAGDSKAAEKLLVLVYDELRRLSHERSSVYGQRFTKVRSDGRLGLRALQ